HADTESAGLEFDRAAAINGFGPFIRNGESLVGIAIQAQRLLRYEIPKLIQNIGICDYISRGRVGYRHSRDKATRIVEYEYEMTVKLAHHRRDRCRVGKPRASLSEDGHAADRVAGVVFDQQRPSLNQ